MRILLKSAALGLAFIAAASMSAAQQNRDAAAANFAAADADGDAKLTANEFTRFIDLNAAANLGNAPRIKRTGQYRTAFSRVDANRDGLVSREEIAASAGQ